MKIVIINTSCGNLYSLQSAIKKIGFKSTISNDPQIITGADKIFLPGVGSVVSVMNKLKQDNLINIIKYCSIDILGICLGMQILGKYSQECNGVQTLGRLNYTVEHIDTYLPVPHMGWNTVKYKTQSALFLNIPNNTYFYFAHSYFVHTNSYTIATSNYNNLFSSIINHKNFFGVQFHPEKSGLYGIQLIKNFLTL
ncbi:imidazole glycerol phosphate synthase subunit HisH [Enterobacteriaceae endosymbiont of Neohaemonia nigricornis]|uniref:imidazole glycerol phosphate synthase subunit HisH n=1 Tax=Enterobacteriaceae endosymbiont of Neohaemonia nigricornis TaxID=2675792 RepID=UPI0014498AFE|nr:imidazole glycerol phosphate synthase subunit HisH [Enterobacteriaceae endosymbiont of Neohaemonia nigricornis]QJC30324.1 imidazole glycerol phosphate synthase subunit HisH [Enterobacteriaceae endosymbiont of Neohaemonia nigricornis]